MTPGSATFHVRQVGPDDLHSLLQMFARVGFSTPADVAHVAAIWDDLLAASHVHLFVARADARMVATATLITAPNLLRGGRSHGFLENVATDPDWQGRGAGTAVVRAALDCAWRHDCHHVLLQSGRPDPRVHAFYRRLGFRPGVRVGYVAERPALMGGA